MITVISHIRQVTLHIDDRISHINTNSYQNLYCERLSLLVNEPKDALFNQFSAEGTSFISTSHSEE